MHKNAHKHPPHRRQVIGTLIATGSSLALLGACGGKGSSLKCAGKGQLTTSQKAARDGRNYVELSSVEGRHCSNCTFFSAPSETGCGTCGIDDLPANPDGHCSSWVKQTADADPAEQRGT